MTLWGARRAVKKLQKHPKPKFKIELVEKYDD